MRDRDRNTFSGNFPSIAVHPVRFEVLFKGANYSKKELAIAHSQHNTQVTISTTACTTTHFHGPPVR
jgi:hypothetical protein